MDFVLVLQFSQPLDWKAIQAKLPELKAASHNGIAYHEVPEADAPAFFQPNPKTLVMTHRDDMAEVLDNTKPAQVVQTALKQGMDHDLALVTRLESLRGLAEGPAMMADQQVKGVAALPEQLEGTVFTLDLQDGLDLNLIVETNTEEAPKPSKKPTMWAMAWREPSLGCKCPPPSSKPWAKIWVAMSSASSGKSMPRLRAKPPATSSSSICTFPLQRGICSPKRRLWPEKLQNPRHTEITSNKSGWLATISTRFTASFPFPNGNSDSPEAQKGKLSWRVYILPLIDQAPLLRAVPP